MHLASKSDKRPGRCGGRELVGPETREALTGLMGGEPGRYVGLEQQDDLVGDQGVV